MIMKIKSKILFPVICLLAAPLLGAPVIMPMWKEFQKTVQDCSRTSSKDRTPAQIEHCKPKRPVGLIIPGVI